MGTTLPSTAVEANQLGTSAEKQYWFEEKRAWQMDRGIQGNKIADILRYTVSGGSAYAHVEPTYTQVAGLTGLKVYAEDDAKLISSRFGSLYQDQDILFVFYDVPNGIDVNDAIDFENQRYFVASILDEPKSGRIEVLGRLASCTT